VAGGLTSACAILSGNDMRGDNLVIEVRAIGKFSVSGRTYSRSSLVPGLESLRKLYPNLTFEFRIPGELLDTYPSGVTSQGQSCSVLIGAPLDRMAKTTRFFRIEKNGSATEIACDFVTLA
jgi:hypothetical protein